MGAGHFRSAVHLANMTILPFPRPADAPARLPATYVLPIAAASAQMEALTGYLYRLSQRVADLIVVDGSAPEIFAVHHQSWGRFLRHIQPTETTTNGKVGGVLTGVRAARYECVVIADDDIRYTPAELERMLNLLETFDVVRPQNHFQPLPWHARWDTARSLLNRLSGGDWPGTLGVRRSSLLRVGGYSGEVLFENLEMVRTIEAGGGRECAPLDFFIARRPPSARHFLSQRVRQAYDEWARPRRFAFQLALLPAMLLLAARFGIWTLALFAAGSMAAAELGRRVGEGSRVFPASSALWAPLWLAERAITSWLALGIRLCLGGVRYRATRLLHAATPLRRLRRRVQMTAAEKDPPAVAD